MDSELQLESIIKGFGEEIFQAIGKEQPSTFNKSYWTGRILEWSLTQPEFKTNMFRLVDVLPALKSDKAIANHVTEYMGSGDSSISSLLNWGLKIGPSFVKTPLMAMAVKKGIHEMASQFIAGENAEAAINALIAVRKNGMCFTVDLLGEFSVSEKEAEVYIDRYAEALETLSQEMNRSSVKTPVVADHPADQNPVCVSVKLTALYSQCGPLNYQHSVDVLTERLTVIARKAMALGATLHVDAEDHANNPIIYAVYKRVFGSAEFKNMPYPGIVVQAYDRNSPQLMNDLLDFARRRGAPIAIRLVKGAYWDFEQVMSSQNGWANPLYSVKESSDANYERLTRVAIDNHALCLPAFASHNVRSLCHACRYAESKGLSVRDFELQMLYGMADPIARAFQKRGYLVRLYVPLGKMIPGMGYLVRRLMENTSNESFLKHTFFDAADVEQLLKKPALVEEDKGATVAAG